SSVVAGHRTIGTSAGHRDHRPLDALLDQELAYRYRPRPRQLAVQAGRARAIGMPDDGDRASLALLPIALQQVLQAGFGARTDRRAADIEQGVTTQVDHRLGTLGLQVLVDIQHTTGNHFAVAAGRVMGRGGAQIFQRRDGVAGQRQGIHQLAHAVQGIQPGDLQVVLAVGISALGLEGFVLGVEYVEQRATADIELFAVGDQYRGGSGALLLQRSQAALQVENSAKRDSRRQAQVDAGLVSQAFGLTDALPGSALGGAVATTAVQIVASAQLDDTLVSVGAGVSAVV